MIDKNEKNIFVYRWKQKGLKYQLMYFIHKTKINLMSSRYILTEYWKQSISKK